MDAMSAGFRKEMSRVGTPSTMNNGLLFPIVPSPRMRMLISSPGAPVLCVICTPATWPWSACATSATLRDSSSATSTVATAPVMSAFLADEYPTTTT
jgi:hypothetical protein